MNQRFITMILFALRIAGAYSIPASAATFTVVNTNDSGTGSLRQAIIEANGAAGPDDIVFAPTLQGTIVLTSGQLMVTDSLTIAGPGAGKISVSGNGAS